MEIWKDVPGYVGLYQVSNLGNIRSLSKKRGWLQLRCRLMKVRKNKHGYLQVHLMNGNNRKTFNVHRLVAIAFIPNPENKPCIDHIDTDKTNNHVDNLHWVTYSENSLNPITNAKQRKRTGLLKDRFGEKHPNSNRVFQYTKDKIIVAEYGSVAEAIRQTGIANISYCANGKRKTAGGYKWKYKE